MPEGTANVDMFLYKYRCTGARCERHDPQSSRVLAVLTQKKGSQLLVILLEECILNTRLRRTDDLR